MQRKCFIFPLEWEKVNLITITNYNQSESITILYNLIFAYNMYKNILCAMLFFNLHFKISRKYKSCLVKFDILPNCGQISSYSKRMTS